MGAQMARERTAGLSPGAAKGRQERQVVMVGITGVSGWAAADEIPRASRSGDRGLVGARSPYPGSRGVPWLPPHFLIFPFPWQGDGAIQNLTLTIQHSQSG